MSAGYLLRCQQVLGGLCRTTRGTWLCSMPALSSGRMTQTSSPREGRRVRKQVGAHRLPVAWPVMEYCDFHLILQPQMNHKRGKVLLSSP